MLLQRLRERHTIYLINDNRSYYHDETGMLRQRRLGGALWHGRLYLGRLHFSWRFGRHGVGFGFGGAKHYVEPGWHIYLALPKLAYLSMAWEGGKFDTRYDGDRYWDFRIFSDLIWVKWACDDMQSPPRYGWEWHLNWKRFLFGKSIFERENVGGPIWTVLTMPEGEYEVEITLMRDTWRRPRWFGKRTVYRADIRVPGGVPLPGKGENSWDLDDDAVLEMTCMASTFDEALQALHDSVMRTRRKYGSGVNWRPGGS